MSDVEIIKSRFVLEAGADPAKVEALRVQLMTAAKVQRNMGIALAVFGVVFSVTILGAIIGVPALLIGVIMIVKARSMAKNIGLAAEGYLASI